MRKLLLLAVMIGGFVFNGKSQTEQGSVLLNGVTGVLINSSSTSFNERLMVGAEMNYFVANGVSLSGGVDYRTINNGQTFVAFGSRVYPANGLFFLRHRSMVNIQSRASNDFLLGAGYDFMMNDTFALEVNADYYFVRQALGLRFGIGVFF